MMSIRNKTLEYVENNPGCTPREIAEAAGGSVDTVRSYLKQFRTEQLVHSPSVRYTRMPNSSQVYATREYVIGPGENAPMPTAAQLRRYGAQKVAKQFGPFAVLA